MARTLYRLIKFIRYRFLVVAGLLPYILGGAIAFYYEGEFNFYLFLIGLGGLLFVLIGIEAFNEFFDYKLGTDRVFLLNLPDEASINKKFISGVIAFFIAFIVAFYLTLKIGSAIIILAGIGFLCAFFYLGPPLRLAYRGLGEVVISISYGPLMMMGSYYLHTQKISSMPILVSIIPAVLLFTIAILNEVPDYLQDKLVGKQNICVRIGRKNIMRLYGYTLIIFYAILIIMLYLGKLPYLGWIVLMYLPILLISYINGIKNYDNPFKFISTIRGGIIHYVFVIITLTVGYIL